MLADPGQAAEYLNAALEEGEPAAFLMALKDVANVHGSVGKLAEIASLNRENMYRMLSEDGNPRINSLNAILHALGLRLSITPKITSLGRLTPWLGQCRPTAPDGPCVRISEELRRNRGKSVEARIWSHNRDSRWRR